ncbi:hypothetical protein FHS42_000142 [Streptomyces zagrosensis]|uniref:Uncharacterized protein n=1 Tax=Streptomyces zagrosensis TaxID=1042984 RepID=A0A7W9Q3W2_9ACTN|nr:hypothetical protein [Streptomyces zagrosensis]
MGLAVYIEDQVHGRSYAGPEAGKWLSSLVSAAAGHGQLAGVHVYGDTMFNVVQLRWLLVEIERISAEQPKLSSAATGVAKLIEEVIKQRGYLWISGD